MYSKVVLCHFISVGLCHVFVAFVASQLVFLKLPGLGDQKLEVLGRPHAAGTRRIRPLAPVIAQVKVGDLQDHFWTRKSSWLTNAIYCA